MFTVKLNIDQPITLNVRSPLTDDQLNAVFGELRKIIPAINSMKGEIMVTQTELIAVAKEIRSSLQKTAAEIVGLQSSSDELTAKIAALETVVAAAGDAATPELVAAVTDLKDTAKSLDDQIPDPPVIPPIPGV